MYTSFKNSEWVTPKAALNTGAAQKNHDYIGQ